jgi:hypothetical protein
MQAHKAYSSIMVKAWRSRWGILALVCLQSGNALATRNALTCAQRTDLRTAPSPESIVEEVVQTINEGVKAECTETECDFSEIARNSLDKVAAKHTWTDSHGPLDRAKAVVIVGLGAAVSFGAVTVVARQLPAPFDSLLYGAYAFVGLEILKSALSIEFEPGLALVRQALWRVRNGFKKLDPLSMNPNELHDARYRNTQSRMTTLQASGRSANNNAHLSTSPHWIAAHDALVKYLEDKSELRLESLVNLFASAVPAAWLNCSSDFPPDDPILTGGARQLLADFAKNHGVNLYELTRAPILKVLRPKPHQIDFYNSFIRNCLTPTAEFSTNTGL